MLVQKVVKDKRVQKTLKLPQSIFAELDLYCRYYEQTYGEPITTAVLVEQLLDHCFAKDREFKKFKEEHQLN